MQKVHVSVRCDPALAVQFGLVAQRLERSTSDLLRAAMEQVVHEHLNNHDLVGTLAPITPAGRGPELEPAA